jgi:hypothetical protein
MGAPFRGLQPAQRLPDRVNALHTPGHRSCRRSLLLGDAAEHGTEKRVAPSRLRERARIAEELWDAGLAACRVITIDEVAERIEHDVLGDRHADGELPGVGRQDAPHLVKVSPNSAPLRVWNASPAGRQPRPPRVSALPRRATSE